MRVVKKINENWLFTKKEIDIHNISLNDFEKVTLPHTWNNLDGQSGEDYLRQKCYYAYQFIKPQSEELWIEFRAVSQIAEVYCNGILVKYHEGGFSTFRANLTEALKEGENLLVVSADNSKNDFTYPQMADFTFFGGIYRDVYFIECAKQHFDLDFYGTSGLRLTPLLEGDRATISVEVLTVNYEGDLKYELLDQDAKVIDSLNTNDKNVEFKLENPHLWNGLADPYQYELRVSMPNDSVSQHFGIRNFKVDANKGFYLNGKEYCLRGVSRHQCWQDKGWAITEKEMRTDMELIKDVGANTIRLAHYQHAQEFYDLCDKEGMVVWAEIPFISMYMDNEKADTHLKEQMKELVYQNYHHPSICFWGIANEITIGEASAHLGNELQVLNDLVKEIDKTRLTTIAQVSPLDMDSDYNRITDIVAYNHYFGWYGGQLEDNGNWLDEFHQKYPNIPLGLSEYGAEGNVNFHTEEPQNHDYTEEYHCVYHEGLLATFESRPYLWATYLWNMFEFASAMRDEGDVKGKNNKGLVNFDRTIKKDAYYLYKAYWSKEHFLYLCGKRYAKRLENTNIKVYGNGFDTVSLYLNGELVAEERGKHVFNFNINLHEGINVIEAKANGFSDKMEIERVNEPEDSYRYKGSANMRSWFESGALVINEGYYSINDTLGDLMQSAEAKLAFGKFMQEMSQGSENEMAAAMGDEAILKMMSTSKVCDLINLAGKRFPEDAILAINEILNKIPKA